MGKFSTAWKAFWTILHSDEKAQAWQELNDGTKALPQPAETDHEPQQPQNNAEAVHVLAILQREARLVDFIQEDISQCDDDQIGAAVRKIHDDAKAALHKYFDIVPIQQEPEGESLTLPDDFDNRRVRLTGKPAGNPPFSGILIHQGWQARKVNLPTTSAAVDTTVIAPAEIEIQ